MNDMTPVAAPAIAGAQDKRRRLQAVLKGDACLHPASVYDPVSARAAEAAGFEVGMLAGSIASFAILGEPDIILLTLTELADQARRMGRVSGLPLLVDADHGYGNALNCLRTVEELETAGVAGLTIEDTWLPAAYGTSGKSKLIPLEEGVGKMRAALAARRDRDLAVVGRTSALSVTGLDDTIARVAAYAEAGADAIFLAGTKSFEQLAAINAATSLPLILGPTAEAVTRDLPGLRAHNVRLCLQGHLPFSAALQALHDTYAALRGGTDPAAVEGIAPDGLLKKMTRAKDYARFAQAFLGVS